MIGRISSFSFVVNGSFDRNWIMIDRTCFRCSSIFWAEFDSPRSLPQESLPPLEFRSFQLSFLLWAWLASSVETLARS